MLIFFGLLGLLVVSFITIYLFALLCDKIS